jgi:hypothetical protein
VCPDVEIATPGIDCPHKTDFPTPKGDPCVFCRIIQTFMMDTIQEFYHTFLVQKRMIYDHTIIDAWCIGADTDELDGNNRSR